MATMFLAGLLALAAPIIRAGPGGPGGGSGHGAGGFSGHGGHPSQTLAGHGSGHTRGPSIGHSVFHLFGRGGKEAVAPRKAAGSGMVLAQGFRSRPRGAATAFVVEAPVRLHHLRHSGFAGCPEFGFSTSLFWRDGLDCWRGGFFFDPFFGGFARYDFPVTGGGLPGLAGQSDNALAYGRPENSPDKARSAKPTLLALVDGSEFALAEYWLEGHDLRYVTAYGARNSVPIERIDLERTVTDNAERGVEFVLRPRAAGTSNHTVTP